MLRRLTTTNTGKATVRTGAALAHEAWLQALADWANNGRIPAPILVPAVLALSVVGYRAVLEAERRWPVVGRILLGSAGGPTYTDFGGPR